MRKQKAVLWGLLACLASMPVEAGAHVVPHRALYTMALDKVRAGSGVTHVEGTMIFEWADACDGWAIQQRMHLDFIHTEGDSAAIDSTAMMWEAKDGADYTFTVRRLLAGKDDGSYKGRAVMRQDGGNVTYTMPGDKPGLDLPSGTVFPSAHTEMIVNKAKEGEKFFTRRVFDGSDDSGSADVSAFIGEEVHDSSGEDLSPEVAQSPLLKSRAWPVRLAFFRPDTPMGTPDYEMDLVLQENGIARLIKIDYGDFSVKGTLAKIDSAALSLCPK